MIIQPQLLAWQMGNVKPGPAEGLGSLQSQDRTQTPQFACGLVKNKCQEENLSEPELILKAPLECIIVQGRFYVPAWSNYSMPFECSFSFCSTQFHLFLCSQAFFSVWLHVIKMFYSQYISDPFFHLYFNCSFLNFFHFYLPLINIRVIKLGIIEEQEECRNLQTCQCAKILKKWTH